MSDINRITINEKGFIKNLSRLGFTKNQCFAEIFTNSIDAKSTEIIIEKNKKTIRIIDNGKGMNNSELRNKYDLMKQRTRDRDTTGCAGIGGTTSEFILAKVKSVILTKKKDSEAIFVAEVDWNRVYTEQKLFDSINFRDPTDEEKELFLSERNGHGTTTVLYFSKEYEKALTQILAEQFHPKKKKEIPQFERFDIIFGHKNCKFVYKHWKTRDSFMRLELYNLNKYREEDMNYKFKDHDIEIHREINSGNLIYICEGRIIDIHGSTGRGKTTYRKNLTKYIKKCDTEIIGILKLNLYNPFDEKRFDINDPKLPCASNKLNCYEEKFFRSKDSAFVDREFIQEMQIYRNNHYLGIKKICNRNSARADGKTANKLFYTRSFIEFFVESNEDEMDISPLDEIFGIQLNKNQNNQDNLPIPLGRLIQGLIEEFHIEVWKYFEKVIDDFNRQKVILSKESVCNDLINKSKLIIEGCFTPDINKTIDEITCCISDLENIEELAHYDNTLKINRRKLKTKLKKYTKACSIIEKVYYHNIKNPRLISNIILNNQELLKEVDEKEYINLNLSELQSIIRKIKNEKKRLMQERLEEQRFEEELLETQQSLEQEFLEEQQRLEQRRFKEELLENKLLEKEKFEKEQIKLENNLDNDMIKKQEILKNDYIKKIKGIFVEAKTQLNPEIYKSLIQYKFE